MENSRRVIARNTIYLYIRMFVMLVTGLYVSRVVLEALGVDDYGIYSLLSGFVTVFAFLNTTMTTATMRFLNDAVGKGDVSRLRHTFGTAVWVHLGIAALVLVLAETVGMWYVDTYLDIAPSRMSAARVVYRMSVLVVAAGVLEIPFTSAIMSHERMGIYTLVNVLVCMLKVAVAVALLMAPSADNLVFYSVAILGVTLIGLVIYVAVCRVRFAECRGRLLYSASTLKEMLRFSGLDTFGNMAWTLRLQGTAVILNRVGGTAVNAAAGLATIVANALQNFGSAVLTAFRPQIFQSYSKDDTDGEMRLLVDSARTSVLLLTLVIAPAFAQMNFLMSLWLVEVPDYAVVFAQLLMIATYGEVLKSIVDTAIHATGRVGRLSFITGGMFIAELVAIYFIAREVSLTAVFAFHAMWILIMVVVETLILRFQMPGFGLWRFLLRGVFQPLVVLAIAFVAECVASPFVDQGWQGLFISVGIALVVVGVGASLFVKNRRFYN